MTNDQVKSQVSKVLRECERRMYKSVAFPAIGTGLYFLGKAMCDGGSSETDKLNVPFIFV